MNRHQQFLTSSLAIASLFVMSAISSLLGPPAYAVAINFTASGNANVLRQYNLSTGTNRVTASYSLTSGLSWYRTGSIDGSGNNEEIYGFADSTRIATETFTLPGPVTINSYMVQYQTAPASLKVQYLGTSGWTDWDTSWSPTNDSRTVRTPGTVVTTSQIRTIATGPTGDQYLRMYEIQTYLSTGQTVCLDQGYSYMHDKNPATVYSTNGTVWAAPNGGTGAPSTMTDQNFANNELKAQTLAPQGGNRAYVTYDFGQNYNMMVGTLGGSKDQGWGNWELYTATGTSMPALSSLSASTQAMIQAAGWTLQYTQGSVATTKDFLFGTPSDWRYVAVVWNVQFGGEQELELFGLPEPTSLSLLALGGLALVRRRR